MAVGVGGGDLEVGMETAAARGREGTDGGGDGAGNEGGREELATGEEGGEE